MEIDKTTPKGVRKDVLRKALPLFRPLHLACGRKARLRLRYRGNAAAAVAAAKADIDVHAMAFSREGLLFTGRPDPCGDGVLDILATVMTYAMCRDIPVKVRTAAVGWTDTPYGMALLRCGQTTGRLTVLVDGTAAGAAGTMRHIREAYPGVTIEAELQACRKGLAHARGFIVDTGSWCDRYVLDVRGKALRDGSADAFIEEMRETAGGVCVKRGHGETP